MNTNDNNKTGTSGSQGQTGTQQARDEQAKQASAPGKEQDNADTAKRDASGTGNTAGGNDKK